MPVFEHTGREGIDSGKLLGGGIVFRPPRILTPLGDGDAGDGGDPDCTGCEQPDPPDCCYYVVESIGTINYDSPFGFDAEHGGLLIDNIVTFPGGLVIPGAWWPWGGDDTPEDEPENECDKATREYEEAEATRLAYEERWETCRHWLGDDACQYFKDKQDEWYEKSRELFKKKSAACKKKGSS